MKNVGIASFKAGLIGKGIQASLTPALHMAEGRAQGFEYFYELFDLDGVVGSSEPLTNLLAEAEGRGLGGLNITHPFKQQVIEFLDTLSDEAVALGAVNTIVLRGGRRHGHNTDWWGFAESFRRGLPRADLTSVVQLGAGGAGAATAFAILRSGAAGLTIFDQDESRSLALVENMQRHFPNAFVKAGADLSGAMATASGLIHATPTGMAKYPGLPVPADLLRFSLWVAEVVYFPLSTELVIEAGRRGCRTLNGGGMAVFQAVKAFQLFTGVEPDAERMLKHFEEMTRTPGRSAVAPGDGR